MFSQAPEKEIIFCAPPLSDDDFNKQVGRYSQSIYMRNSTRALTATSVGNLVVWDTNKPHNKGKGKRGWLFPGDFFFFFFSSFFSSLFFDGVKSGMGAGIGKKGHWAVTDCLM